MQTPTKKEISLTKAPLVLRFLEAELTRGSWRTQGFEDDSGLIKFKHKKNSAFRFSIMHNGYDFSVCLCRYVSNKPLENSYLRGVNTIVNVKTYQEILDLIKQTYH